MSSLLQKSASIQLKTRLPKSADFTGEMVFVGYGLEDDYKGKDLKGKVAVALYNTPKSMRSDVNAHYRRSSDRQEIAKANEEKLRKEAANEEQEATLLTEKQAMELRETELREEEEVRLRELIDNARRSARAATA